MVLMVLSFRLLVHVPISSRAVHVQIVLTLLIIIGKTIANYTKHSFGIFSVQVKWMANFLHEIKKKKIGLVD